MKKIISLIIIAAMLLTTVLGLASCTQKTPDTGLESSAIKIPVIGINQFGEHPSLDNCRTGFLKGLEESGLVEGVDFEIDYQNAGFDTTTAGQIAQTFVSKKVSLMCGIATPSATACFAASDGTDIPTVFNAITDPAAAMLTEGNVTGVSDKLPVTAQLDLIRKIQPDATKIGIIYTASEPNSVSAIAEYKAAAADYGFEIVDISISEQSQVTQAVDTLISREVDCFSNLTDNTVVGVLASILEKTNEAGIPVYGSEVEQVKIGCVASAGIDYYQLGINCGKIAAKILKGEAEAKDIQFETVSDYAIYINSEAAEALGITIPTTISENAIESGNQE